MSIRFYKDHEVRAVWDDENSKWWFSVLDVLGAINGQEDHQKNRNYWKYLKNKLKKEGNEQNFSNGSLTVIIRSMVKAKKRLTHSGRVI